MSLNFQSKNRFIIYFEGLTQELSSSRIVFLSNFISMKNVDVANLNFQFSRNNYKSLSNSVSSLKHINSQLCDTTVRVAGVAGEAKMTCYTLLCHAPFNFSKFSFVLRNWIFSNLILKVLVVRF